jgi:hypothetical protein
VRQRARTWVIVAALLACAAAVFVGLAGSGAGRALDIRLMTVTNTPYVAWLTLSNRTTRPIGMLRAEPQSRVNGDWPKGISHHRTHLGVLGGRQATNISVLVPSDGQPWRAPIVWGYQPTRFDFWRAVVRENWRAALAGQPLPGYGVNIVMHTNFSPVLGQPRP